MSIPETTRYAGLKHRIIPMLDGLPRPVYARVEDLEQRHVTRAHSHPWVQLSYASRGVLQIRTAQGLFVAPPQWAILVPPGLEHTVLNTPGTAMRSLYIEEGLLQCQAGRCEVLVVSPLLREMIRHFANLPAEYDEDGPHGRVVGVLLDLVAEAEREGFSLPWPNHEGLERVCAMMAEHPQKGLQPRQWAAELGMSVRTLERLFGKHTGMSMRQWRVRARLLHALPLLERGEPVTEVSLACGYESVSSFIAAFREFFGRTPGGFSGIRRSAAGSSPEGR